MIQSILDIVTTIIAYIRQMHLYLHYQPEEAFELPIQRPLTPPLLDTQSQTQGYPTPNVRNNIIRTPSPVAINIGRLPGEEIDYFLRPIESRHWPQLTVDQYELMITYPKKPGWAWIPCTREEYCKANASRYQEYLMEYGVTTNSQGGTFFPEEPETSRNFLSDSNCVII